MAKVTKLGKYFVLSEFTQSRTARKKGISNKPGPQEIANLKALVKNVLDPVRAHFGKPVVVTSGYRSPELNRRIGGSRTSQHVKGQAADFTIPGISNYKVAQWIHRNLNYDQLIYEFGEHGWLHVGYSPRHKNQELSAKKIGGRTRYLNGLVK